MKILFINRSKSYGGFSVEELFQTIQNELVGKGVHVFNYEYDPTISVRRNILKILDYDVDIYHITSSLPNLIRYLDVNKTIFTVHDINRYLYDLKGVRKLAYKWYYLFPLRKLKYTTVISHSVKEDLVNNLKLSPDKVRVIYNCYRAGFKTPSKKTFESSRPKILHIGTKPWKNLN